MFTCKMAVKVEVGVSIVNYTELKLCVT